MKSLVNYDNMQKSKHIATDTYEVGELKAEAQQKLFDKGWALRSNQLCGRFDGIRTFVDFLEANGGKFGSRVPNRREDSSHGERFGSWVKYKTYEECVEAVRKTPETFRHFTEADIRINEYASNGNDVSFDVTGDYLDVGRVMSGEPECFGTMRNGLATNRFANIVVNGNHAGRVNRSWIEKKAERVTRLVDFLEVSNVRVKLTMVFSNDNSHLELIVKQYNDRLDLNDVSVALSADFFRRFEFYFSEHSAQHEMCYGRANNLKLEATTEDGVDLNILVNSDDIKYAQPEIDGQFDAFEKEISEKGIDQHIAKRLL